MRKRGLWIGAGVLLLIGCLGAGTAYWMVWSPNTPSFEDARSVKIPPEADYAAALDSLDAAGVLDSRTSFDWMARLTGWGEQIKPGHYAIEAGASNHDLLDKLRRGLQDPLRLTIPPGSTPEVVAAVVAAEMPFSKEDFLTALRDSTVAADLGTRPEAVFGHMLPETYFVYWLWDAPRVVRKVADDFDAFYTDSLRARADSLGLSTEEVLTLASIVEWETYIKEERPTVAGVYLNRLQRGWPLQADPTIQYGLLETEGQKRRLTFADYELAHPYNTYRFAGLPPGPITNPSPSSIRAVVDPDEHGYMYFVASPEGDGRHVFSRTLREHNRNANAYRQALRDRRRQQTDGQTRR